MDDPPLLERLVRRDGRVVFFPVRHHSPSGARAVRAVIGTVRPDAVLIEGPSDFNDRIDELLLDHELPIAIYSYLRQSDGGQCGAFYPFSEYSPEWQALVAGRREGARLRFIDLPWRDVAFHDRVSHRYADAELRRGDYVRELCERLGVDDFDSLWDKIVEGEEGLSVEDYFERVHRFCFHLRDREQDVSASDRVREAFMSDELRRALDEFPGRLVVVTGGFHSSALCARLHGLPCNGLEPPQAREPVAADAESPPLPETIDAGIALTPYSYERLDSLTGYDAGLPSPGFYDHVWRCWQEERRFEHRQILSEVVIRLRERGQVASTADLIGVETTARALAALRGRANVWRTDLLDGVHAALVKEEVEQGGTSPFLSAVLDVFRGTRFGRLAAGTRLPPLVHEIRQVLEDHQLTPHQVPKEHRLDLHEPGDQSKSRIMHGLRLLEIAGFQRVDGIDLAARDDLVQFWEQWRVLWSPRFDAGCIEAARYGTTLRQAVAARLSERAAAIERNAALAAQLLLDAALAGIDLADEQLGRRLTELIRQEGDFLKVSLALGHLLFLYCYDEVFGGGGSAALGDLLRESFTRGAWLLEMLGQTVGQERELLNALGVLVETFERAHQRVGLDRDEFVGVLSRVEADRHQLPLVRGAAVGGLWRLGGADAERVMADMLLFSDSTHLGDFLTGLFGLARESAQRNPEFVRTIDGLLMTYSREEFVTALPSLRLAFTYFTPREVHHMLTTLFESIGDTGNPLETLTVDPLVAAEALAWEGRLFETAARFGVRGGTDE